MITNINEYNKIIDVEKEKCIIFNTRYFHICVLPKNINIDTHEYQLILKYVPPINRQEIFTDDVHLFNKLNISYTDNAILVYEIKQNKIIQILKYIGDLQIPSAKIALNNTNYLITKENGDIEGIIGIGNNIDINQNGFTLKGYENGLVQISNYFSITKTTINYSNKHKLHLHENGNNQTPKFSFPRFHGNQNKTTITTSLQRNMSEEKLTLDEIKNNNQQYLCYVNYTTNLIQENFTIYPIFHNFYSFSDSNNHFLMILRSYNNQVCAEFLYGNQNTSNYTTFLKYYYTINSISYKKDDLFYIIYKTFGSSKNELQLCKFNKTTFCFDRLKFLTYINQYVDECNNIYFDEEKNEYLLQYKNIFIQDNRGGLNNLLKVNYNNNASIYNYMSFDYITHYNQKEYYETEFLDIYPKIGVIKLKNIKNLYFTTNINEPFNEAKIERTSYAKTGCWETLVPQKTIYTNKLTDIGITKNQLMKNSYVMSVNNENFYVYKNVNILNMTYKTKCIIDYNKVPEKIDNKNTKLTIKSDQILKLNVDILYLLELLNNNKCIVFENPYFFKYGNKTYQTLNELKNNLINDIKIKINDTFNNKYLQLDNTNIDYYLSDVVFISKYTNMEYKPQLFYNSDKIDVGLKNKYISNHEHIITSKIPNIIYDVDNTSYNFRDVFDIFYVKYDTINKIDVYIKNTPLNNEIKQIILNEEFIENITNYEVFNILDSTDFTYNIIDTTNVTINGTNNNLNLNIQNDNHDSTIKCNIGNYKYVDLIIQCDNNNQIENNIFNEIYNKDILSVSINKYYTIYINIFNKKVSIYKNKNKLTKINTYNEFDDRCIAQFSYNKNNIKENVTDKTYHTYKNKITNIANSQYSNGNNFNITSQYKYNSIISNKTTSFLYIKHKTNTPEQNARVLTFSVNNTPNYVGIHPKAQTEVVLYNSNHYYRITSNEFVENSKYILILDGQYKNNKIKINNYSQEGDCLQDDSLCYNQLKFIMVSQYPYGYPYNHESKLVAVFNSELPENIINNIDEHHDEINDILTENEKMILENKMEEIFAFNNISTKELIITFYKVENDLYILINNELFTILQNNNIDNAILINKYGNHKTSDNIEITFNKSNKISMERI